jgi:hypothetical protein
MCVRVGVLQKYSIIEGKTIAIIEAMKGVKRRGFVNVIFEFNSKSIVDATHYLHIGVFEFSSLILRCLYFRALGSSS